MHLLELGLTPYHEAWELQREIFQRVISGEEDDTLILVEHPPVYTFGRGANMANFLLSDEKLHALGAEKFEIERGGDVTYHGPGQLVGYPILNLAHFKEDLGWYLRALEETIIEVLKAYNVEGFRIAGRTGVWVQPPPTPSLKRMGNNTEEKICAIGVHASRWCTMHGFAFNVNTDLSYFEHIVPCGISDRGVTSLEKILGHEVPMEDVRERYLTAFKQVFQVQLEEPSLNFN
jgi:lipoyl(octanoyl) transferase